jgi:hypothetical protein
VPSHRHASNPRAGGLTGCFLWRPCCSFSAWPDRRHPISAANSPFPSRPPLRCSKGSGGAWNLPLPRHTDLVSIETSDLQTDAARGNLLVLNATLRNRAPYAQDYPSLELSLTDTQDVAIARRVFSPLDYLPPKLAAEKAFPANADIPIRLWIEARELSPAGYRLYVFYP